MKIRSIKFNFAMNLLLTASTYIFPLITFPYVSRTLQPAAYGQANYATSVVSYFSMFAALGVSMYGSRECARVRDDAKALARVVEELLLLTLGTSVISLAVLYLCILMLPILSGYTILLVINSATILLTTIGVEWFFRGVEQYAYITVRSLAVKTLSMLALFTFVHSPSDLYVYAAISVIVNGGAYIWNFGYMLRSLSESWVPLSELHIIRHLKPMVILFLSSAAISVYTNLDAVMLGAMVGDEAVGFYSAAIRIKSVLTAVTASLGSVIVPRASYYYGSRQFERYYGLLRTSSRFAIILSVPIAVICYEFANTFILLLAGPSYIESALLLRIVLPAVVFIGMTQITANQMLLPTGMERPMALTYAVAAIVDFLLNLVLIPRIGAAGAALSTTVAEFVVLFAQSLFAWPIIVESRLHRGMHRLAFPLLIATAALFGAVQLCGTTLLSSFVLSAVYLSVLTALLVVFKEEATIEVLDGISNRLGTIFNR